MTEKAPAPDFADIPKMIAREGDMADKLNVFVHFWGLDSYTPPEDVVATVRGIVTLALNAEPSLPDPRDAEIARLRDALAYTIGALRVVSAETKTDPQLLHLYGIAQAAIDLATLGPEGCSDCDAAIARARGENP